MADTRTAVRLGGRDFAFWDVAGSTALKWITHDLDRRDVYQLARLALRPGDVVFDVGAHVGVVSVYLASMYPGITIHAYEPHPVNFENLTRNLKENAAAVSGSAVCAYHRAVTADGRVVKVYDAKLARDSNSGSNSMFYVCGIHTEVSHSAESVILDAEFERLRVVRCALLKMDCEGAEYEILRGTKVLPRVDVLAIEPHSFDEHRRQMDPAALLAHVREASPHTRIIAAPAWKNY